MQNIRKDSTVGIIEKDDIFGKFSLHFSEWWNGEGMDFTFDEKKVISLHSEEMKALMVAALAAEMVDIGSVMEEVVEIKADSKRREQEIERIRSNYVGN